MADIFFSYARRDIRRVEPLVAALEGCNWSVWWDPDVHGGESWSDVIEAELTQAKCVIVAWSKQSAKSEWVKEEARIANRARKLVPVLLEPMDPPFGFGGVQTLDLAEWEGSLEAVEFQRLCSSIRRKIDGPVQTTPPVAAPDTQRETARPSPPPEAPPSFGLEVSAEPGEELRQGDRLREVGQLYKSRARMRSKKSAWFAGIIILIGSATIGWFFIKEKTPSSLPLASSDRRGPTERPVEAPPTKLTAPAIPTNATRKADYNVSIRFAGEFDRAGDIVPFAQKLRAAGWRVADPKSSSGTDRDETAAGLHQVRYGIPDDRPVAEMLAADVLKTGIDSLPLDVMRAATGISGENLPEGSLQVVISSSGPRKPPRAGYNVSIRFAGDFDRTRDIAPFAQKLRAAGWVVTESSGGNDRDETAAGLHQVRYGIPDDRPVAEMLAADVLKAGIDSPPLDVMRAATGISGENLAVRSLQVVISPSGPRKPPR